MNALHPRTQDFAVEAQWLYRQAELVLGPLPEQALIEKLYTGEVNGRTEAAPMGAMQFRPIAEISAFQVHLAKAEAKLRVEAAALAEQLLAERRRNVAIAVVVGVAVAVGAAAAAGARYFAVHNPFAKVAFSDITVEPPTITRAHKRKADEDLVAYTARLERTSRAERGMRPSSRGTAAPEDADGMQTESRFDQSAINAVVAARQKTLYACFGEEAQRNPRLSGRFPIEFVIGNDGKVNKLWVDHPDYKQGPLPDCLFRELQKWPFKPYQGEQATVGLSFQIRAKG